MSENISMANASINTYDEVPYESYPYSQSYPGHISAIGKLFGMATPKLETARILELGCAAGGNILPFAVKYPKSKCVGIDLSQVQIDHAKKQVEMLGIKNMEFKCASITDVNEKMGKFDYIVCHGVISWVPGPVREAIFDICGKMLSDNGIAYVSYNTLPGWNMVRSIRDMMLYHSKMFSNTADKVQQSRLLLEFVKDSLEKSETPYAQMLKHEATLLAQQPDHYLRHDHLEETNKQFYFNEFMEEASKRSMQYLGDASISSMFLGNFPAKVVEKLQTINDIVRTEQYMDFINNRRFRSTLLCKNGVKLNRSLKADDIKDFYLSCKVNSEKELKDIDINNATESVTFYMNGNKDSSISTSSPRMKAIFYTFAENWNNPLSYDALLSDSTKKLSGEKKENVAIELMNNAMRLVLSGYISLGVEKPLHKNKIEKKPKAYDLAIFQATNLPGLWVTNTQHDRIGINVLDKLAIRYMDGNNDKKQILAKLLEHATNGDVNISKNGEKIADVKVVEKELSAGLDQTLERLKVSAVLI